MSFNSSFQNKLQDSSDSPFGLTREDIVALTNYPSIGKLFESNNLSELTVMQNKLNNTFNSLERVVVRGSNEDSTRAKTAAEAVKIAIHFLEMLRQMKTR